MRAPALPDDDGLTATDCTGVLTGNADIVCERGTAAPSDAAPPLPVYPLPHDLPEDP